MSAKKPSLIEQFKALLTNKNLIIVIILVSLNQVAHQCSRTYINSYGKALGAAVAILGFAATANSWGKMLVRPFAGRGLDKFSPRAFMIFCAILRAFTYLLFAAFNSVPLFVVSRLLEGCTYAMITTSLYSLTGLSVTKAQMGIAISLYGTIPQLFTALGIQLGAVFYEMGEKVPFYAAMIMVIAMCPISMLLKVPPRNELEAAKLERRAKEEAKPKEKKGFKLTNFIALEGLWFAPQLLCNSFHNATEDLLVVMYATSLGFPAAGALYFSVSALVKMWAQLPAGVIADRFGAKYVIYGGLLLKACAFFLIVLSPTAIMFSVAGVLRGLGMCFQNVLQAQAIKVMPKAKMGIANSTHMLIMDVGVMIAATVAGLVTEHSGYSTAFMIAGVITACGAIAYAMTRKKIDQMVEEAMAADAAVTEAE